MRVGLSGIPPATWAEAARPAARLTVRAATEGDLVPLSFFFDAILRRDYFLRRGQLREIVCGQRHRAFVAEIEGVLVGVAIVSAGARLINVLVHPAYRGLGIGRTLVSASGATEVRVKRDMSTGDPREFYRSLGFVETGSDSSKDNVARMQMARVGEATAAPAGAERADPGMAAARRNGRKRGSRHGIA